MLAGHDNRNDLQQKWSTRTSKAKLEQTKLNNVMAPRYVLTYMPAMTTSLSCNKDEARDPAKQTNKKLMLIETKNKPLMLIKTE